MNRGRARAKSKGWPDRPYKGLSHYDRDDAPLLAGRGRDVRQCAESLIDDRTVVLTLHGETACGKSSFLRAGLLPSLEDDSGYSVVPDGTVISSVIARSGQYPLRRLAENLLAFVGLRRGPGKTRAGRADDSPERDVRRYIGSPSGDGTWKPKGKIKVLSLYRAVQALTQGSETLILVIDQAEEVFHGRTAEWEAAARDYFDFLHLLCARPLDVRVCISMRSEYKARFDDQLLGRGFGPDRLVGYYLAPLDEGALIEAILHPTRREVVRVGYGSPWGAYRFEFEPDLPEEIARTVSKPHDTLSGRRVLLGGVLPTVQVICDRLWSLIGGPDFSSKGRTIKREHFLSLGHPTDQILWHLEESLYEALSRSDPKATGAPAKAASKRRGPAPPAAGRVTRGASPENWGPVQSAQIDCWMSALHGFVVPAPDGRATTKMVSRDELLRRVDQICRDELTQEDERFSAPRAARVVDHLLGRSEYVLQHVATDEGMKLALVHDAIGLVLGRWKNEYDVLKPSRDVERTNPVLSAAHFDREDLFDDAPPAVTLRTIDDRIWDHLLAIYADRKGFLDRVGFRLEVDEVFPCPKPPDDEIYNRHLSGAATAVPRLVVLPPSVFPGLRPPAWQAIGVSSLYRGWALIGRSEVSRHDIHECPDIEGRRKTLSLLVEELRRKKPPVFVLDERGARFYRMLGELDGAGNPLPKPTILGTTPDRSDPLYKALVDGRAHYVVGSAPTRALCEQAPAFKVFVDYLDLETILPPDLIGRLSGPPMHEVWLVDRGLDESALLRLASVMFYTVDYIRTYPEDYVRFLYDRVRVSGRAWPHETDTPIGLRFIRNAVSACYRFAPLDLYPSDYLLANSPSYFRDRDGWSAEHVAGLHNDMMRYRAKCYQWLARLTEGMRPGAARAVTSLVERGNRNLQIYNYLDAESQFRRAVGLLSGAEAGAP